MRMYTIFTESHRKMLYKYFIPSLIPSEYLLTIKQFHQQGNGTFTSPEFRKIMIHKMEVCIEAIKEAHGQHFVFSDCDIQFFGRTKEILLDTIANCDMAAQKNDDQEICAGFFICKASDKMRDIFSKCIEDLNQGTHNDQVALNRYKHMFTWKFLNARQFWCPRYHWKPGKRLNVPEDILVHHANWTVGIGNKIKMLATVKEKRGFISFP